ncbi:MAG TPA: YtxH domain-containing protein [Gemmatimonadales bacterium]|nr:YtxH domain-containing protein [Gemmatimonadales bacterium]
MSERGSGLGPFVLGLGLGAILGFLFAPEAGAATRGKLERKLRGLRDLATDKADELGQLLETGDEEEAAAGSARDAVERRFTNAKRRRRGTKEGSQEEDEPVG